jgi:signal recognition particle GTPase
MTMSLIEQALAHYNAVNADNEREAIEREVGKMHQQAEETAELVKERLNVVALPDYAHGTAAVESLLFMASRSNVNYHWTLYVGVTCPECQEHGWVECNDLYSLGACAADNFKLSTLRHECRSQEQEAERAEHERNRAEAKALQEQQRAHLIDQLMRNPVAFRLLQAMVEHVREREAWQKQLDNTNDYLAEMETSYGARLGRAEQSARDAQREAENARCEANEARDDASRVQRKLQQLERER